MPQLPIHCTHDVGLEALPNERFKDAYGFWLNARGDFELPPQSAIKPENLPAGKLPRFTIVSVEGMPRRFRYRLLGSMVTRAWGEDLTGRFVDEMPNGYEMAERMEQCAQSRKPYYSQGPLKYAIYDFRSFEVLVMPFAGPDNEVSRLLIYNEFV